MDKHLLLEQVVVQLKREVDTLTRAANEARGEATHAETKQEGKYDTRGLEASYLAHGQSKRAAEVLEIIEKLKALPPATFDETAIIRGGACLTLDREGTLLSVFVLPYVGGLRIHAEGKEVQVISTTSPLAQALIGKETDDEITFSGRVHVVIDVK